MVDFHQEGIITTLHALYEAFDREEYLVNLECKLEEYSHHQSICLLLPCFYTELHNPQALNHIMDEIQQVSYLKCVVVAFNGTSEESEFRRAREYFKKLHTPERDVKLVWVDGPCVQSIFKRIQHSEIHTGIQGKGQAVWITLGYVFAREDCEVIALHDCDIVTYDRMLLGRLIEPTANPNNDFEFCKGYYARISPTEKTMRGRVTRLFVTPFVDAIMHTMHERGFHELEEFFAYHRTYNYPLAGEFSFTSRLARGINIAYDWGLEVSTLSEVYQRVIPRKIAQIDLLPNYEHKHQVLSQDDSSKGLHKMVVDIAKFYLNYMRSHGLPLDDAYVDMIRNTYYQTALQFVKNYSDDAEVNNLAFDRLLEERSARYFRDFIETAWQQCKTETESTLIPSWNRVCYSVPEIYTNLLEAVEKDNT